MIPYSTQTITDDDLEAVREVLASPYLTCGPKITEFEDCVASYTGAAYAVGVNSCTSALHLAMVAADVGPSDRVFVSAISFVASANCARFLGADVDFVDVDRYSGNMNIDALEQMLSEADKENRLPKAVVAVHLSGRPVDLERLYALRSRYGFVLIEDAAHALGASYKGSLIGSCRYSDITVLSFHPVKIITTAEGGMCLTNDEKYYQIMKKYSSHGIEHDREKLENKAMPAFYYEMQELGFNYRLSDLQAALGVNQMTHLDEFLKKRREIAKEYPLMLADCKKITLPDADSEDSLSSWHLYQIGIADGRRDEVYQKMRQKGIGVQIHYLPIYDHPYYQKIRKYPHLEGAEYFFAHTLSIPLYPSLKKLDMQMVCATLMSILDN
ncbi:MAG: UDP-4-amino-4,6-dideoxy-N-acetyl-beta-L-altrosamine transaminase [Succinivibrio sp.]